MSTPPRACIVVVFLLLAAPFVCAQAGASSVKLSGQVSGAVTVSVGEARSVSEGARVAVTNVDAQTVAVNVSSPGGDAARVTIPVTLRSNVAYALRASLLAADELNVGLSIAGTRATGKFVHADALAGIEPDEALAASHSTDQSRPPFFVILNGPPVSKAGTFDSPDNAIEVLLSVDVKSSAGAAPWSARLVLSAAPSQPFSLQPPVVLRRASASSIQPRRSSSSGTFER